MQKRYALCPCSCKREGATESDLPPFDAVGFVVWSERGGTDVVFGDLLVAGG
jgi:hypothetical protein